MITKSGTSVSGQEEWRFGVQSDPGHCADVALNMDASPHALLTIRAQAGTLLLG